MDSDRVIKVSLCGSGSVDITQVNFFPLPSPTKKEIRKIKRERIKLHGNGDSLSDFACVNSEDMKSDDFLVSTLINDEFEEAGVVGTMGHSPFGGFEEGGINFDVFGAKSSISLFLGETARSVFKGSENGGRDVDVIHQTRRSAVETSGEEFPGLDRHWSQLPLSLFSLSSVFFS